MWLVVCDSNYTFLEILEEVFLHSHDSVLPGLTELLYRDVRTMKSDDKWVQ